MAKILSGREVALQLNEQLKERIRVLRLKGLVPSLCVVRVGEDPGDISYETGARKRCELTNAGFRAVHLPGNVSQEELIEVIRSLNEDPGVHGVLLLRPLPGGMNEAKVVNSLLPSKDVDGMTDLSMSGILTGRNTGFAPCTAEAAMAFLDHYGIDPCGKRAVVVGRSLVFGKPAALMLLGRNATITVCHTRTRDLPSIARQADILMVACGHAGAVGRECLRDGQIVIDVGINVGADGKMCGDVDFAQAEPVVGAITPVPGGVGAVTTAILVRHVVEACERI